ncbi:MAG: penicillin-binding protein activator [Alphaproteobacteria bacterium]|nr:penicillin-binding protein activator [Alphaproteobacteria bacterium]
MFKNRIFGYIITTLILAGCATTHDQAPENDWFGEYDSLSTSAPINMYGTLSDGYGANTSDTTHNMAVLLPLSGDNAPVGKTIRTSVETAILQSGAKNLNVSFYDTSDNLKDTIKTVLAGNPEIIIGPVFSNNARIVREEKPENLPVLSFTSDATAVGDGVMTMALMPTNGIESIVREMNADKIKKFIIMAPDTDSGHLMAGTAIRAAEISEIEPVGIFYYNEKDTDSIKNVAQTASLNNARTAAHTRARQVLSDILTNEQLTAIEKSNLNIQLDKLSKTETVGPVPYQAILFLGGGEDTKTLASFLRYYNVGASDARFYGTAMWDGSDIASDVTMSGAKYATLSDGNHEFKTVYEKMSGTQPNRLATFGYDATNMAIGMMYSDKSNVAYLLDPSGYIGTDGLFRLKPTGDNERALRIVKLNGTGTPIESRAAASSFATPLYNIEQRHIEPADAMELQTPGINPNRYIMIPERLQKKYRSKTIGANITEPTKFQRSQIIAFLPEDDSAPIKSENYKPIKLESVNRSYIDEYEIEE